MTQTEPRPPAVAQFVAELMLADAALRDSVMGDLAEEHHAIEGRASRSAADAWYRWQVVRSVMPLATMSALRRSAGGWLRVGGAVVIGYATLVILVLFTNDRLGVLLAARDGAAWAMPAASLAAGVVCAVIAGYVAAVVGGAARLAAVFALGVACTTLSAMMLRGGGDGTPLWYRVGLAAVVLPAVFLGGVWRARGVLAKARPNPSRTGAPPA